MFGRARTPARAQLETESEFDAAVVSPVGAQGIAQFMPGTWPQWGRDENGDGVADLRAGLSARAIADQLGHARPSMTQNIYLARKVIDPATAAALGAALGKR